MMHDLFTQYGSLTIPLALLAAALILRRPR